MLSASGTTMSTVGTPSRPVQRVAIFVSTPPTYCVAFELLIYSARPDSRNTNPTVKALERKVQALEMAEDSIAFSSGMAAISSSLFALLKPGDRVVRSSRIPTAYSRYYCDLPAPGEHS